MEMLAAWLRHSVTAPTWQQLIDSLERLEETSLAESIKRSLLKRKGNQEDSSSSKRIKE